MTSSQPAWPTSGRDRSPAPAPAAPTPHPAIAVYGCDQDDAALFSRAAARRGVGLTITGSGVSVVTSALARGTRCISIDHKTQVTRPVLIALRGVGVRYISTRSAGYDHIDLACAHEVGIAVENVAYSPDSVADYTLMLMLMVLRHARATIQRVDLHDYRLTGVRGKELRDLTVGVVGTGRIGSAVINRLRGFGCRTLAYDTRPRTDGEYVGLDELLQRSDILTLHVPLTVDTYHLLDRHRIGQLQHGAVVINTARGPLIDTAALTEALEQGRLAGAALDVIEGEEGIFYTDCSRGVIGNRSLLRLQRLSNVLISPHAAYYTDHAASDMVEQSITNCLRFEQETACRD